MPFPKSRRLWLTIGGTIVLGTILVLAVPEMVIGQIRRSHVEANVPQASDFEGTLARDLQAWFTQRQGGTPQVRFELLRRGPTQTGVAYPKYYAWVEVKTASPSVVRGAVRIAAVQRDHFEVLQFLSAEEIRARPDDVPLVFPAALVPEISRRATER